MNAKARLEPGSFRDPGGRIYRSGEQILRTVTDSAISSFSAANDAGVLRRLVDSGSLVEFSDVTAQAPDYGLDAARVVLAHPSIPFISYPYEWSFSLHKAAALAHLDLQISLLDEGFTLSDATAYNIQFEGVVPVFIDHLSIRPYREGEIWAGHRQFCMQFLNPLLMWSKLDLQPSHWFRGTLEGITPEDLARLIPWHKRFNLTVLTHVIAQAAMQRRSVKTTPGSARHREARLPRAGFEGMLKGLRSSIAGLEVPSHRTVWGDYARNTSYSSPETETKHAFVKEMVGAVKPGLLYDIGCNSGDYSLSALAAGAKAVIGFDFDQAALEIAYRRARDGNLPFLPLWLDAANPSPNQGWGQEERKGFSGRANPDALLALAFIHHIAIGRNVPLDMACDWIVAQAPVGIIEFPHRDDPMVHALLAQREDIFPNYDKDIFARLLSGRARIVKQVEVSPSRTLFWFDRS